LVFCGEPKVTGLSLKRGTSFPCFLTIFLFIVSKPLPPPKNIEIPLSQGPPVGPYCSYPDPQAPRSRFPFFSFIPFVLPCLCFFFANFFLLGLCPLHSPPFSTPRFFFFSSACSHPERAGLRGCTFLSRFSPIPVYFTAFLRGIIPFFFFLLARFFGGDSHEEVPP